MTTILNVYFWEIVARWKRSIDLLLVLLLVVNLNKVTSKGEEVNNYGKTVLQNGLYCYSSPCQTYRLKEMLTSYSFYAVLRILVSQTDNVYPNVHRAHKPAAV